MLHPFGLMGTAIDEIYHVFSKGCARWPARETDLWA